MRRINLCEPRFKFSSSEWRREDQKNTVDLIPSEWLSEYSSGTIICNWCWQLSILFQSVYKYHLIVILTYPLFVFALLTMLESLRYRSESSFYVKLSINVNIIHFMSTLFRMTIVIQNPNQWCSPIYSPGLIQCIVEFRALFCITCNLYFSYNICM